MCINITEALLENVIEITWVYDNLFKSDKLSGWVVHMIGSSGIKSEIIKIAKDFEKKFSNIDWEDTDLDYIVEIEKFAKKKLIESFGA